MIHCESERGATGDRRLSGLSPPCLTICRCPRLGIQFSPVRLHAGQCRMQDQASLPALPACPKTVQAGVLQTGPLRNNPCLDTEDRNRGRTLEMGWSCDPAKRDSHSGFARMSMNRVAMESSSASFSSSPLGR